MNPTHRIVTHAGRVLLSAALIATLTLAAPPPPARADERVGERGRNVSGIRAAAVSQFWSALAVSSGGI